MGTLNVKPGSARSRRAEGIRGLGGERQRFRAWGAKRCWPLALAGHRVAGEPSGIAVDLKGNGCIIELVWQKKTADLSGAAVARITAVRR